jgi:glyoxylase-like metal-dependent hydrolase (beta-lactamase superfamily II)
MIIIRCGIDATPVAQIGIAPIQSRQSQEASMTRPEQTLDFSIWSFCYAKGQVPRDFVEGAPVGSNQGLLQIPMIYSVIAAPAAVAQRTVLLVDTGFASGRSMTGQQFADFETPAEILAKVELEPNDIKTVLLTHLHFDHVGNIGAFKNATFLLQRSEYDGWKQALKTLPDQPQDKTNWILSSLNLDDIDRFDRAIADGRVIFIDGTHEVCPGIKLHLAADTHTFGSQWIEVATPGGPHVVAGDAVACYANLERMWPPGYHQGNCWNLLDTYRRLRGVVGEGHLDRIVPGHDMEVFRRTPSWTPGRNPVAEVHLAAGQRSFIQSV